MHTPSRWQRVRDVVLSSNPRRRTLVCMALLALVLMACSAGVMLMIAAASSEVDAVAVQWWAAISVGGLMVMTAFIRSGATAGLDVAVADYNGAVVNAIKQTADAMTQVKSLEDRRAEARNALASATRAFTIAEQRYRLGLANQLPMLTAEASVLQARQQIAALAADATAQRVTLLLAAGGAFRDDIKTDIAKQD